MRWGLGTIAAACLLLLLGLAVVAPQGREGAVVDTSDPRFVVAPAPEPRPRLDGRIPVESPAEDAAEAVRDRDPHGAR